MNEKTIQYNTGIHLLRDLAQDLRSRLFSILGSGIKHIDVIVEKNIKCYIAGQEGLNG